MCVLPHCLAGHGRYGGQWLLLYTVLYATCRTHAQHLHTHVCVHCACAAADDVITITSSSRPSAAILGSRPLALSLFVPPTHTWDWAADGWRTVQCSLPPVQGCHAQESRSAPVPRLCSAQARYPQPHWGRDVTWLGAPWVPSWGPGMTPGAPALGGRRQVQGGSGL